MMTKLLASAAALSLLGAFAWSCHRGAPSAPVAVPAAAPAAAPAPAPAPSIRRAFRPAVCTDAPPVPVFDAATGTCEMDAP